jgi:hypothetical protein
MTTTIFNLPANILSTIYEMDSTFRDKFKDEINYDIWSNSFDKFRRNLIKDSRFDGEHPILTRKLDFLLQYLFEYEVSIYNQSVIKGLVPDQITIYLDWHENGDTDNEGVYARIFSSQIFEGNVYTIDQYNLKYGTEINYDAVFRDDEFVIVQRSYDSYYEEDYDNDMWSLLGYDDDQF